MKLPKHIQLIIEHNPHKLFYEEADKYIKDKLKTDGWCEDDFISKVKIHFM